jgi:hypothetical protein
VSKVTFLSRIAGLIGYDSLRTGLVVLGTDEGVPCTGGHESPVFVVIVAEFSAAEVYTAGKTAFRGRGSESRR